MKKILSVLLALTLVFGVLVCAGCAQDAKAMLDEAAKILTEMPYTMTMKMNFTSDDAEMNELFQMMNMEVPATIDGENLSMDMSMDLLGETMKTTMSLVDKVLYYDIQIGDMSQKMKVSLSDEQFAAFRGEQTVEMPVDYSQFAELTSETRDGKTVITCTGITDEGKQALNDQIADSLAALDGSAVLDDFSYVITLKDGKYERMDLSCTYTVTVEGETLTMTMVILATFAYDNVLPITAPADADAYTSVNYSDLLGG